MNVGDFITAFRTACLDQADPPFWASEEIVGFLNEAVQEASERAKLIEDRSTSSVCALSVVIAQDTYPLHPSVLEINRATFNGRVIDETSVEEEDSHSCGWEQREGQPRRFIYEPASGARPPQLRLVPRPNSPGAIALTVYRGALRPLSACSSIESPELPTRFHTRLLHWMMYRAHLKQDADTFDTVKAGEHLALFEQAFGRRDDANVQRKHRDDSPPLVHSSW
ncbi:phage adaptor protein [Comamonas sp. MYb69]|uniref:phage adaptor protein n=1 Tax=Comamonas sp. MYb69 TaxID=1848650 RepID=UPI0030B6EFE8